MIRVVHPESGFRTRILTFYPSRIPGSKRHQFPDPGSGSATLTITLKFCHLFLHPYMVPYCTFCLWPWSPSPPSWPSSWDPWAPRPPWATPRSSSCTPNRNQKSLAEEDPPHDFSYCTLSFKEKMMEQKGTVYIPNLSGNPWNYPSPHPFPKG